MSKAWNGGGSEGVRETQRQKDREKESAHALAHAKQIGSNRGSCWRVTSLYLETDGHEKQICKNSDRKQIGARNRCLYSKQKG